MNCADLERYLEAHLDGQLARNRLRALKQHLLVCTDCRLRVHNLQAFEQQLQSRFRCMQESMPLWAGLEVDLVGETETSLPLALPPPPMRIATPARIGGQERTGARAVPRRPVARPLRPLLGRYAARFVGLAMLAAAAATVVEIAAGLFTDGSEPPGGSIATDLEATLQGGLASIETADRQRVVDWLLANLGVAYPVPLAPAGFTLRGARVSSLAGRPTAAVIYGRGREEVVLYIAGRETGGSMVEALGRNAFVWWDGDYVYGAVGPLGERELRRFREVVGAAL